VPHLDGIARMSSATGCALRFCGPSVAVRPITLCGVQTVTVVASSRPGAACVNRFRLAGHKVPRRRSSSGRRPCGLACSFVSCGFAVESGGVCRGVCGRVHSSLRSQPGLSFDAAVGAGVRSAKELMPLSHPFTHGSLTTRSSGPGSPSPRARIGRALQNEAPTARLRRRWPAAQRER
jgi:hypothetical protein